MLEEHTRHMYVRATDVARCQGDQIGRIFAYCAIVSFGQSFLTKEKHRFYWILFSTVKFMY
jgi:hypothetical protein